MGPASPEPPVEPPPDPTHALGPIELDRASIAYYATCRCGQRFGPMSTAGMLHAAFAKHRDVRRSHPDPEGPDAMRIPEAEDSP